MGLLQPLWDKIFGKVGAKLEEETDQMDSMTLFAIVGILLLFVAASLWWQKRQEVEPEPESESEPEPSSQIEPANE